MTYAGFGFLGFPFGQPPFLPFSRLEAAFFALVMEPRATAAGLRLSRRLALAPQAQEIAPEYGVLQRMQWRRVAAAGFFAMLRRAFLWCGAAADGGHGLASFLFGYAVFAVGQVAEQFSLRFKEADDRADVLISERGRVLRVHQSAHQFRRLLPAPSSQCGLGHVSTLHGRESKPSVSYCQQGNDRPLQILEEMAKVA